MSYHFNIFKDREKQYTPNQSIFDINKQQYCSANVVMNYITPQENYLGIQNVLAQELKKIGLTTVMLFNQNPKHMKNVDLSNFAKSFFVGKGRLTNSQQYEANYYQSLIDKRTLEIGYRNCYFNIFDNTLEIKSFTENYKLILEKIQPKYVILLNNRHQFDTALKIAAKSLGIKTILIPHGHPQISQGIFDTDCVVSLSKASLSYLKKISSSNTRIKTLPWLEPVARKIPLTLPKKPSSRYPLTVLVLSQDSGWKMPHRCVSLLTRLIELLQGLVLISEVGKVILRRRFVQKDDEFFQKKLSTVINSPKVVITGKNHLVDDLSVSDVIVSLSSTGLLYAPYLRKKGIEIRDNLISSVWGGSLLSDKHILDLGRGQLSVQKLRNHILNDNFASSREIFYDVGYQDLPNALESCLRI
ncbi:hypothetical protein [Okeania sp.]|uniref:hypothetical protein n=1 Tax=Okeania sp. TaxID=3100323 RepID=UPI002B4B6ED4|nr:hypothetical protein [Okeania sp.]MEB3341634.1 hypothetical protein [Okeania sp.]